MYKFLSKYGQAIAFGIGAFLILLVFILNAGVSQDTAINFELGSGLVLLVIGVIVLIGFGLFHTLTNPRESLKGILGVAALLVVFAIIYFAATPESSGDLYQTRLDFGVSDGQTKFISGAISTALILIGGAALAFIVSEVSNFFK
jgi:hypothetical protein